MMKSSPPGRRRAGGVIATFAMLAALLAAGCSNPISNVSSITKNFRNTVKSFVLHGNVPQASKSAAAKDAGALASSTLLNLSISLPLRNQALLQALLTNQYDPNSPLYHKFLTPGQFQTQFGPLPATVTEVSTFLKLAGLQISGVSTSNQFINVTAPVKTIESAFNIQLHQFTVGKNTYYAPTSDPSVPSTLSGLIQNVSGLDNFSLYHPGAEMNKNANQGGYTLAQLSKAYNATGLTSQGFDGSGQNIAFLELADYNSSDIQNFQQQNNVTGGTFQTVQVDGGSGGLSDGTAEVELDMEVAFGIAPKVNELVYEGPNSNQGINDVYSQIVNDNKAKIVSISWGLCENSTGSAELQTLDQIFAQGAAQGMAFFAAAGDSGAYDCGDGNVQVDSPADDPNVTGVSGTSLTTNSDGSYGSEKAWSCASCTQQSQNGTGGGGGISQAFQAPTYQSGLNPSGTNGQTGRYVPDVSADADPNTGYTIYCTVSAAQCDPSSPNIVIGGTSAAAPLWAGGMALMTQSLAKQNKTIGNLNAALYSLKEAGFHDVTSGDNLLYQAGSGYDLATGLGSPDFATLAQDLANGTTGTGGNPTPTPTPGGNPTPTPTGSNPTPTPTSGNPPANGQDLLQNGGFENGQNPWAENSAGGYELIADANGGANVHAGNYAAYLCGYRNCQDELAQAFQVPSGFSNISLSFWWEMQSDKSGDCADQFTATIYSTVDNGDGTVSLGSPLSTAKTICDKDATGNYVHTTVNLTNSLHGQDGKALALVLGMTTNSNSQTSQIFVDDVSMPAN
jgi:subtilase family serine protease